MADSDDVGCLVGVVIIGALGWFWYADQQQKTKSAVDAAVEARLQEKAKADTESAAKREEESAITLAREAHTMAGDWPVRTKGDEERLSNDYQVRSRVARMKGDLKIIGWQARKFHEDTYVVSFSYEHNGETRGWPFEVNVRGKIVRAILGDPELEKKYGWGGRTHATDPTP